jgi:predicted amidophosphoribosyltransferase
MTTPTARCIECRQPTRGARRCPDCREPVHQRCHAGHACPPKRARVAALAAVGLTV